jgi:hypothetical protein
MNRIVIGLTALGVAGAFSCTAGGQNSPDSTAGTYCDYWTIQAEHGEVGTNGSDTITLIATNPNISANATAVQWSATAGTFPPGNASEIVWVSPGQPGKVTISAVFQVSGVEPAQIHSDSTGHAVADPGLPQSPRGSCPRNITVNVDGTPSDAGVGSGSGDGGDGGDGG